MRSKWNRRLKLKSDLKREWVDLLPQKIKILTLQIREYCDSGNRTKHTNWTTISLESPASFTALHWLLIQYAQPKNTFMENTPLCS